ncbi:MAG: hypothetical protein KBD76_09075 [Bacteriovorax sp.]|nr:hypothetical protein [Bacteriovorax sp.]
MNFIFGLILLLLLPNLGHTGQWTGVNDCGLYQARGIVRLVKHIPVVVINEESLSEIILSIPNKNEFLLAPYLDMPVEAKIKIQKLVYGNHIKGEIEAIHERIPNPLNPKDTGIKLVRKSKCL